jgi:hypothetical protein
MRLVTGFPPRRPRFDPRSRHVGFVVDKVALWQVFTECFGFPCQFSFHRLLHNHVSSGAGKIGQIVADIPSGLSLSLTPPHEIKKKIGSCLSNRPTGTWNRIIDFLRKSSSCAGIFRGFSPSLLMNDVKWPQIRPRPFPSPPFPIHYSLQ